MLDLYLPECISSIHVSRNCLTISRSGLYSQDPVSQINPQIVRDRSGDGNGFDACLSKISELSAAAAAAAAGQRAGEHSEGTVRKTTL